MLFFTSRCFLRKRKLFKKCNNFQKPVNSDENESLTCSIATYNSMLKISYFEVASKFGVVHDEAKTNKRNLMCN